MGFVVRNEVFVPGDVVCLMLSAGYCLVVVCRYAVARRSKHNTTVVIEFSRRCSTSSTFKIVRRRKAKAEFFRRTHAWE